ncbi:unnamed protein product, partial [Amoebophrya sp. A25]
DHREEKSLFVLNWFPARYQIQSKCPPHSPRVMETSYAAVAQHVREKLVEGERRTGQVGGMHIMAHQSPLRLQPRLPLHQLQK